MSKTVAQKSRKILVELKGESLEAFENLQKKFPDKTISGIIRSSIIVTNAMVGND